jgi:xanthine dehydrogenase accessory factor
MKNKRPVVIVKGAGDLASGVAYRLFQCGLDVILTELPRPLVVRRNVSFAAAVHDGEVTVEGVKAKLAGTVEHAVDLLAERVIPVVIDPEANVVKRLQPAVVVDARMAKRNLGTTIDEAPLVLGLGPGFTAGLDVHAVIETCRGHDLGRVLYTGAAAANTGAPGAIDGYTWERLLRAPADGTVLQSRSIGEQVEKGDIVAFVDKIPVCAEISGLVRGMIKDGIWVPRGTKIGDIDPRKDTKWDTISDKALAIGGGVLEAVFHFLSRDNALPFPGGNSGCEGAERVSG